MSKDRTRIVTGAALETYRRQLAESGRKAGDDGHDSDTVIPAPVIPGPSWYRSTLWPDPDLISTGNGGWWDDGADLIDP